MRMGSRSTLGVEQLEERVVLSHSPIAPEIQVNQSPTGFLLGGNDIPPLLAVASDAEGDFVVAWRSENQEGSQIFVRLFNKDGSPRTNDIAMTPIPIQLSQEPAIDVAMDADGDFVVVFDLQPFTEQGGGVFAQRFDANGVALDGPIQIASDVSFDPDVAMDDMGNFIVAYRHFSLRQEIDQPEIFVQRVSSDGILQGGPVQVPNSETSFVTSRADVDSDSLGNFVITWAVEIDELQQILAQRFSFDAVPQGNLIEVTSLGDELSVGTPSVAIAEDGSNTIIAWTNHVNPEQTTIEARLFNGEVANGDAFILSRTLVGSSDAVVAADQDGDFVIAWSTGKANVEGADLFARTYTESGIAAGELLTINSISDDFRNAVVDMDRAGNFVVAWPALIQANGNLQGGFGLAADGAEGPPEILIPHDVWARVFRQTEIPPVPVPVPIPTESMPTIPALDPAVLIALARQQDEFEVMIALMLEMPPEPILPKLPLSGPPDRSPIPLPSLSSLVGGRVAVGEISGRIFEDLNGDGVQGTNEPGLPRQIVFLDLNKNGNRDPGEPSLETNEKGDFIFDRLRLDDYFVIQDLSSHRFQQTTPPEDRPHRVPLRNDTPHQTNVNFGSYDRFNVSQPPTPKVPPKRGVPVSTPGKSEEQSPPKKKTKPESQSK